MIDWGGWEPFIHNQHTQRLCLLVFVNICLAICFYYTNPIRDGNRMAWRRRYWTIIIPRHWYILSSEPKKRSCNRGRVSFFRARKRLCKAIASLSPWYPIVRQLPHLENVKQEIKGVSGQNGMPSRQSSLGCSSLLPLRYSRTGLNFSRTLGSCTVYLGTVFGFHLNGTCPTTFIAANIGTIVNHWRGLNGHSGGSGDLALCGTRMC